MVHLELPLEVRDHAQALDHRLRLPPAREVDDELGEDVDLDVVEVGERLLQEPDALLEREQRLSCGAAADDADDDAVEDRRRARDHVEVPERHGVVRAWADRGDHRVLEEGQPGGTVPRAWCGAAAEASAPCARRSRRRAARPARAPSAGAARASARARPTSRRAGRRGRGRRCGDSRRSARTASPQETRRR